METKQEVKKLRLFDDKYCYTKEALDIKVKLIKALEPILDEIAENNYDLVDLQSIIITHITVDLLLERTRSSKKKQS